MIGTAIVIVGTLAAGYAIVAAIYWTVRPGETEPDHPKRLILRSDR